MKSFSRRKSFNIFMIVEDALLKRLCERNRPDVPYCTCWHVFRFSDTIKSESSWKLCSRQFSNALSTFQRLLWSVMETARDDLLYHAVVPVEKEIRTIFPEKENCLFSCHACAWYVIVVCFQLSTRPSGSHNYIKYWYSNKHEVYCLKTEASVISTGLRISNSIHGKSGVPDISIFRKGLCL